MEWIPVPKRELEDTEMTDDDLVESFRQLSTSINESHPTEDISERNLRLVSETISAYESAHSLNELPDFCASRVSTYSGRLNLDYMDHSQLGYLHFNHLDIDIEHDDFQRHGCFDPTSGIFTVDTPGIYLLNFSGLGFPAVTAQVELRVNGVVRAFSNAQPLIGNVQFGNLSFSATLALNTGDQVGIFLASGHIYEDEVSYARFSGTFLV